MSLNKFHAFCACQVSLPPPDLFLFLFFFSILPQIFLTLSGSKDVGLEIMTDSCWTDDTVFFVFEDDMRFTDVPGVTANQLDKQSAASSSEPTHLPRQEVTWSQTQKKIKGQWLETPTKPKGEILEAGETYIGDLMHYMIQAHHHACGHVVWMTYNSYNGEASPRDATVSYGSNLIAVTKLGAHSMKEAIRTGELRSGHIDVEMKRWLIAHGREVQGSVLCPPIGNFVSATSSIDVQKKTKIGKERQSHWGDSWATPGTRQAQDDRRTQKFLGYITGRKGNLERIADLVDPEEDPDLMWLTWDPSSWDEPAASQEEGASSSQHRPSGRGKGSQGKGKRQQKPAEEGAETVDQEEEAQKGGGKKRKTKREKRNERMRNLTEDLRCWTSTWRKAVLSWVIQSKSRTLSPDLSFLRFMCLLLSSFPRTSGQTYQFLFFKKPCVSVP